MLAYIASNGARTIIVETASRFARDLMVQEVGFAKLKALGIKLIAADSPHSFLDDTPTSKLIRQILGAVSEFDKAMVVAKLKGARERKRALTGKKVEGRKSHAELRPELVALVRQLRRKRPKGGQRSLQGDCKELAAARPSTRGATSAIAILGGVDRIRCSSRGFRCCTRRAAITKHVDVCCPTMEPRMELAMNARGDCLISRSSELRSRYQTW